MSYSRWHNSDWYIYGHINSGHKLENQILAVWHVKDDEMRLFSYVEVKENREQIWDNIASSIRATQRDIFDKALDAFIKDVESHYGSK